MIDEAVIGPEGAGGILRNPHAASPGGFDERGSSRTLMDSGQTALPG